MRAPLDGAGRWRKHESLTAQPRNCGTGRRDQHLLPSDGICATEFWTPNFAKGANANALTGAVHAGVPKRSPNAATESCEPTSLT
jgi:hypothetical protein